MLGKMKDFFKKKKLALIMATMAIMSLMTTQVFAGEVPDPVDLTEIKTAITGAISVGQITAIIAAIIGAGMAFVLIWWGARKLFDAIMGAFKHGSINF